MKRRTAIRNMVIISAGTMLLPAACRNNKKTGRDLKNISLDGSQQEMLGELSETILPNTKNYPGSKDLGGPDFVLTMLDDCMPPEEQKKFNGGLDAFEKACDKKFNRNFVDCTPNQRNEILKEMESSNDANNLAAAFYNTVKSYTVQNFTTSKDYMLNIRKWKMVPGGNFRGCVKV
jgi:hypothetical protein